jgi:glycosyltransferase involved in cell wall biosynthesis
MNVLFLSAWYPTYLNPNYGIFIREHAHAIKIAGNEIIVVAIVVNRSRKKYFEVITDDIDENGVRTIIIDIQTRYRDIIYHLIPFQYFKVRKVLKNRILPTFVPDIIHSNVIFPAGIIGNAISNSIHKPHVITEHWSKLKEFMNKPLLSSYGLASYENATKILPVSNFLKTRLVELFPTISPTKFKVIGNIIDTEIFHYVEKENHQNEINFCAIAFWTKKRIPDKIPELFINALSELQNKLGIRCILTMIGGGDRIEELQELCSEKLLENIFLGFQNKNEIARVLQQSDFYVHASTIETFGIVIAEALHCGTPVICSNVGALPELVNSTNGILCDNTHLDWVKGIENALSKKFNYFEIAQDIKANFNFENIGRKINDIYVEITDNENEHIKK